MQITNAQSTTLWAITAIMVIGIPILLWLVPPPFFSSKQVHINRGASVQQAAENLTEAGVIYTPELLTIPMRLSDQRVVAGTYQFDEGESATTVIRRLSSGVYGVQQKQVVIPEGFTNEQIANRLASQLEGEFSRSVFLKISKGEEGYLYPDTYQFHSNVAEKEIVSILRSNFSDKIARIQEDIKASRWTLDQVIKMASLIEREAADYRMRRRIAGVLWSRYERGMPLQVDAVFAPLLGKSTYELTRSDLRTDSPYNLYVNQGLPPTPIANPGLEAIKATIDPIKSDDLYYLSDANGEFHFAETLAEHNENKRRYLTKNVN